MNSSSTRELLRFLDLIAHYEPGADTLYNRINYRLTGPMSAPLWQYQLNLIDVFSEQDEQRTEGTACFDVTMGVYFPVTDIPVLLGRLEAFNDSQ